MIKIAVCDDSDSTINEMDKMLDSLFHSQVECDFFYSGEELLDYMKKNNEMYDIFLLDIEMGRISGLETAKKIRQESKTAIIIFITSHDEFVYEAFEVLAFNFIVKPVTLEKLNTILSKAIGYLNLLKTKFYYKYNNSENGIDCSDILYFESEKRKMHIYTCNGDVFSFYDTVANTYGKLEPILFIRCHASYIVNLKYVKELNRDSITLTNNSGIPVSNRFRDSVIISYHAFLRRRV